MCQSGSGTQCKLACDEGTFSLVCSDAARTCKGRCSQVSQGLSLSSGATVQLRNVELVDDLNFGGADREGQQIDLADWFRNITTDVYDALSRDAQSVRRPAAIAFALYDALPTSTTIQQTTKVAIDVSGEKSTVLLGISRNQVQQLRSAAQPLITRLRSNDRAQVDFDNAVKQQLQEERLSSKGSKERGAAKPGEQTNDHAQKDTKRFLEEASSGDFVSVHEEPDPVMLMLIPKATKDVVKFTVGEKFSCGSGRCRFPKLEIGPDGLRVTGPSEPKSEAWYTDDLAFVLVDNGFERPVRSVPDCSPFKIRGSSSQPGGGIEQYWLAIFNDTYASYSARVIGAVRDYSDAEVFILSQGNCPVD
jgi:hypothetical protein